MWVGLVSECLRHLDEELPFAASRMPASHYELDRQTMELACRMIKLALGAGVSPLKLNQGVWFFAAHVAGDKQRVKMLLSARRAEALEEELQLMRGFLPSDTFVSPLGEALLQAKELPEADLEYLAKWLKAEVSDERRWQRKFAVSRDQLGELADEALEE